MPNIYVTQLEDMYYCQYIGKDGYITIEDKNGDVIEIDFDFESDFTPEFEKLFACHGALYARWHAAEINDPFVSARIELFRLSEWKW